VIRRWIRLVRITPLLLGIFYSVPQVVSNSVVLAQNAEQSRRQALDYHQQALSIMQEVGDRTGEANILYNLALVQQSLNDIPSALQSIQGAIAIVEDIRGQLLDPEFRTSYFATVQGYYKLQVDLLMELNQRNPNQGYNSQAFNVTEQSKARTLIELLTESRADIRNGVDPQLLQQEQDIQTQLDALDKRRLELANSRLDNNQQIATLEAQRATLQTQYRDIQARIRATSPRYAALKYPQPLILEQVQQQILDDNTLILSYSLGNDRSYLWLVSKTEMTSYQLPSGKRIEDLINQKVRPQLINPRTSRNSFKADTSELSNILLKPVLEKIGNKRLVVISDGALQYLPFGALSDPRINNNYQPLLVNNEVTYLPSATTLQTIRNENQNRTPAPQSIAVLADPVFSTEDQRVDHNSPVTNTNELPLAAQNLDRAARNARGNWDRLPGTRQEAEAILNLFPENSRLAYFDFQANRANALSDRLSQYRFIHWATHGFANPQKPELSGVVMSLVNENGQNSNGYLLLGDIFNLNFNAELVVLSACQTGLGEVVQGEGLIGLTRGLMYAGTSRVVTSLWSVPDAETAILMEKFYTKMLQNNLKPSEALRAAQLELFQSKSWVAPYYWAAFTLQGEWR
jgi:CHAT domain-containing protein